MSVTKVSSAMQDTMVVADLPAGSTVQVVNVMDSALATGTTVMVYDDTIPQNTEGDEYMTLAIIPTNSSNKLLIEVVISFSNSVGPSGLIAAIFQDSTAGALKSMIQFQSTAAVLGVHTFSHYMSAGTTSSTTFKVRAGGHAAGTTTLNGQGGGRKHGGVLASSITITEIKV